MKRFWDKVNVKGDNDCWEWKVSLFKDGYGQFWYKKKQIKFHRFAYAYYYDIEVFDIPSNKVIMHICDNRKCCNPNHLRIGTNQDNMDDMNNKNRNFEFKGENNPKNKLTEKDVLIIRNSKGKLKLKELSKIYNVHYDTISRIWRKANWRHI